MKINKNTLTKLRIVLLCILSMLFIGTLLSETQPQRPSNWGQEGAGTESNPYLISNLANLRWLSEVSEDWWVSTTTRVHFLQTADIDASETIYWNDGRGFRPIGRLGILGQQVVHLFIGVYDGNN